MTPATNAQFITPTGAWNGSSILYDGQQYYPVADAKQGDSHGIAPDSKLYVFIEQISERPLLQKAHVIYFAPGADPPNATSAEYAVYDYSSNRIYSNPQDKKTIGMTVRGSSDAVGEACTITGGLGWVICPISVWLAESMDWLFDVVASMIAVEPPKTGDTQNDLYAAWNVMRSIANVAFMIVFLIIIYSQLTSAGVSNYGLKKLIPRLVIAAVLVNVSYILCALLVDVSNIAGYSLQDILANIRSNTFNIDNETWDASVTDWRAVTSFVLAGGTAGTLGVAVATAGSAASALFLIIPLLLGLLLTILFVLVILAARQAIIVILIIVSPLAFVAYLLPNTEKWFEKWRELFTTMLVFFPAFSLVFAGSQLAGGIILQNATSIVMIIFGLAVQVAPLVITPILLKLSGSLLGRIGSIINDPRKGLMDRAKNWSTERAEMHRQKSLTKNAYNPDRPWNPFRWNSTRGIAKQLDNGNRRVKERTALYTSMNDNRYNRTNGHRRIYEQMHETETEKKIIEGTLERDLKNNIYTSQHHLAREMESRVIQDEVTLAGEKLNRVQEGLRTGQDISIPHAFNDQLIQRNKDVTRDIAATAISIQTAKRVQQNQLSDALLRNVQSINGRDVPITIDGQDLRTWAGAQLDVVRDDAGNITVDNGADSALTYATTLKREAEGKLVSERSQLLKHFKLSGAQRQAIARGENVDAERDGATYTFKSADEYTREAAIETQLTTGSYDEIAEIMALSGSTSGYDYRTTISELISKNGLTSKATFLGGKFIDAVSQGKVASNFNAATGRWEDVPANEVGSQDPNIRPRGLLYWTAQSILEGKIKAEDLANNDQGALKLYSQAAVVTDPDEAVRRGWIEDTHIQRDLWTNRLREFRATAEEIRRPDTDLDRNATQAAKERLDDIRFGRTRL
ncbi:MAG: hypothetical protein WAO28_03210 [Candidatus Microsaccharimonas sp.]